MIPLKEHYKETAIKELIDSLSLKTPMAAPKINKITLNMGLGEASVDKKILEVALEDLALIAGQKPTITIAKKSVANFKIREGMPIGCKVTLRGDRMYDFLQRLLGIAIPRERDFRGLDSKSFDGRGNYSIGIKEHIIFPEIDYDKVDKVRGMDICITTSAKSDKEGKDLLMAMKFPFKN